MCTLTSAAAGLGRGAGRIGWGGRVGVGSAATGTGGCGAWTTGSAAATFAYDVEAYENTCRPDATPCAACSLGATCAYDGGTHTEPNYQLSSLLIAYR